MKKFATLLLSVLLALSATACNGNKPAPVSSTVDSMSTDSVEGVASEDTDDTESGASTPEKLTGHKQRFL